MHSSALGTNDRIVLRSFSSAARLGPLTPARYPSIVVALMRAITCALRGSAPLHHRAQPVRRDAQVLGRGLEHPPLGAVDLPVHERHPDDHLEERLRLGAALLHEPVEQ